MHLFSNFSKVDGYGFERNEDFDYKTYENFMEKYISVLARRAAKWETLVENKTFIAKSKKGNQSCTIRLIIITEIYL